MRHLVIFIIIFFTTACGTPPKRSPPKTGCLQSPCLITFGDSITAGYGAQISYSQRLADKLSLPLLNQGSPGLKLTDPAALTIIDNTVIGPDDIVTMMTCYNDARAYGDNPNYIKNFQQSLHEILLKLHAAHPKSIYVAGCIAQSPTENELDTLAVAQVYASVIQSENVQYIDITNQFDSTNPAYWLNSDQIHPNDTGAEAIATIFYNAIWPN